METLKDKNSVRLINGEKIKNGLKFYCVTFKTPLSPYSVVKHFKTKIHLDNVAGTTKVKISNDTPGYCNICNTRYINKNKHNESDGHNEKDNQYELLGGKWRDIVNELGLDHNMKYNQIMISSSDNEDPRFLEALEALYKIHPHLKFNTFDVIRYTKPTDEQLEENEFTLRLMTS